MKCRREGCENKAAKGRAYCSRACAPFGYLGVESNDGRTVRSCTTELGVPSHRSSAGSYVAGYTGESNIIKTSRLAVQLAEPATAVIETPIMPAPGQPGLTCQMNSAERKIKPDTLEQNKTPDIGRNRELTIMQNHSIEKRNMNVAAAVTRPTGSNQLSAGLEEEISRSSSLVGSSIKQLHGLMEEIENRDPQSINAICNLAKQMTGLIRLQVDMAKLMGRR